MNKISIALILLSLIFNYEIIAQTGCPGCMIDSVNIGTATHPQGGTYPDTLPPATAYQPYSEDITFFIPLNYTHATFGNVEVLGLKVKQIVGLPFGLTWECSSPSNGCFYDPKANPPQSQYGCVKICGTPITNPGLYPITVVVDGTGKALGQTQTQEDYYYSAITVLPNTSGTATFSYSPDSGCDSINVNFSGLISATPLNPVNYNWNYGNGNTGTGQNPAPVAYGGPGIYNPTLTTEILDLIVSDVQVLSVNQNWCGDIEEPSIITCTGSPDLYFTLTDAGANVIHSSSVKGNVNNATWSGLSNIILDNPPYSIAVYDDDDISANDLLGTFAFNVNGTGAINFGGGGTNGSLTITTQVKTSFTDTATITVFANPPKPTIQIIPYDTVCGGDSISLIIGGGDYLYQWFNDTSFISNATDTLYKTGITDSFLVMITDTNGCSTVSDTVRAVISPTPPKPAILFPSPNVLLANLPGYSYQWYKDGIAMPGETNQHLNITATGEYQVVATTDFGCTNISQKLYYQYITGVSESGTIQNINVYPNPNNGRFTLRFSLPDNSGDKYNLSVSDLLGRISYRETFQTNKSDYSAELNLDLKQGVYLLRIESEKESIVKKIIIQD